MPTLYETLEELQVAHRPALAEHERQAEEVYANFDMRFSSQEQWWSIPWLGEFGAYVARHPDEFDALALQYFLGEGAVKHHGATWGVADAQGQVFGVFDASRRTFSPVESAAQRLLDGDYERGNFGLEWVYLNPNTPPDFAGPQLVDGAPADDPEGWNVGTFRWVLFIGELEIAFARPGTRLSELPQLAALTIAGDDAERAVALYNRALELGMEPVEDQVNEVLAANGRIPLI